MNDLTNKNKLNWLQRTELLLGLNNLEILRKCNILVVGLGGVGAYAAENICRAGVGRMTIVDGDLVNPGNINRQLHAMHSTIGMNKAELMKIRLLDINPQLDLKIVTTYINDSQMEELIMSNSFDYIVDAIDTLAPKINLIEGAFRNNIPVISSMGAGGKTDPLQVRVTDISESFNCRLAFLLRKKLRKMGINSGIKVVFSTEPVNRESVIPVDNEPNKKSVLGTVSYLPSLFGCYCAGVVVNDLISPGFFEG